MLWYCTVNLPSSTWPRLKRNTQHITQNKTWITAFTGPLGHVSSVRTSRNELVRAPRESKSDACTARIFAFSAAKLNVFTTIRTLLNPLTWVVMTRRRGEGSLLAQTLIKLDQSRDPTPRHVVMIGNPALTLETILGIILFSTRVTGPPSLTFFFS